MLFFSFILYVKEFVILFSAQISYIEIYSIRFSSHISSIYIISNEYPIQHFYYYILSVGEDHSFLGISCMERFGKIRHPHHDMTSQVFVVDKFPQDFVKLFRKFCTNDLELVSRKK